MAENQKKKTYPQMPVTRWWELRERFKKTIPATVTPSYVASALDMSERSASANILPTLRVTKIIDGDGKPTDRAVKWRDDGQYKHVCDAIRKEVYPKELLDLAPDEEAADREEVQRWFANTTGVGHAGANKMASLYMALLQAEPGKAPGAAAAKPKAGDKRPREEAAARERTGGRRQAEAGRRREVEVQRGPPSIHLNVQVHISPDMTAEQIDQVFESMARHLKEFSLGSG